MNERRTQYDICNNVNVTDSHQVQLAVLEILDDVYPNFNHQMLQKAFDECHQLFIGEHPDYLPCDALYHDEQHTLDMTLALARLISGHEQKVTVDQRIGPERATLGIITALYHDSGYMLRKDDQKHYNGAEYTLTHVSRGAEHLKHHFNKIGEAELALHSANMVHYTGLEVAPEDIILPDQKTHLVGHMLGTADYIAQMADRCYLEKCYERLYVEFVLAGIAVQVDEQGKEHTIYESAEDLLRKTPIFYENDVKIRLEKIFNNVYQYEDSYFKGEHSYIQNVQQNQDRLVEVLEAEDLNLLRREPPENYGTQTFPGLEKYLSQHPQQKAAFKAKQSSPKIF